MTSSRSASAAGAEKSEAGSAKKVRALRDASRRRSVVVTGDRVMMLPPGDAERRSKGGIVIPATAKSIERKGLWGEVIGVGPHVRHVEAGDEVLYLPDDAIEVDIQAETYLVVRERDVHAIGSTRAEGTTGLYL